MLIALIHGWGVGTIVHCVDNRPFPVPPRQLLHNQQPDLPYNVNTPTDNGFQSINIDGDKDEGVNLVDMEL